LKKDHSIWSGFFMSKYSKQMATFGHRIWRSKIIDYVTATITCHHDQLIFGGYVTSIYIDCEVDWGVEKNKQAGGSYQPPHWFM
jgi:hypothetical protein